MRTYLLSTAPQSAEQGRAGYTHVAPIVRDVLLALRVRRADGTELTRAQKLARLPWGLR